MESNIHRQTHTHEFIGSVFIHDNHDHRTAGVSGEIIQAPGGHIHEILSNTSFEHGHYHKIRIKTGLQILVSDGRHIHFVQGITTTDDNHTHGFEFSTLI